MKNRVKICGSILLVMLIISACKKDDKPPLTITEPTIITKDLDPAGITDNDATISITLQADGNSPIKTIGYCWSRTNPTPTIDDMAHTWIYDTPKVGYTYNSKLAYLNPFDTYYVRAYATNEAGKTGYGETRTFKTMVGTVTDVEGNVYHTITIGNQVWMQENLKTFLLNDFSAMTNGNIADWSTLGAVPAFCVNPNVNDYKNTYGLLYNWYAVNTGKLAPSGWHVPSKLEWDNLLSFLGGAGTCAIKLKNNNLWVDQNPANSNSTGFTALPGGDRYLNGGFYSLGTEAHFWANNDFNSAVSGYIVKGATSEVIYDNEYSKNHGFSVRCIRNLPATN